VSSWTSLQSQPAPSSGSNRLKLNNLWPQSLVIIPMVAVGVLCGILDSLPLKHATVCHWNVPLFFMAQCETMMAEGRTDMVMYLGDKIFIFEFKVRSSAKSALDQINRHKYYEPWRSSQRTICKVRGAFRCLDPYIEGVEI